MVPAIVTSLAIVACGGSSKTSPTATAKQGQTASTPAAQATTAKQPTSASSGGGSAGSINDVPVYPGATKVSSGELPGTAGSIPAIGSNLNAADYATVDFAIYQTNDDAQTVVDWYTSHMSGWTKAGSFSGGTGENTGAFAAWTKDNGNEAAWITVGASGGQTSLSVWFGTK
jgi:hypothetical protein